MKRLCLAWELLLAGSACAQPARPTADTTRQRRHLVALTTTPEPRNYLHEASLNQAADYIKTELAAAGARPTEQGYTVLGRTYRNTLGHFGPETGPILVIGAHYDVCGEQPGADDNGSGVAALLELARLLGQHPALPCRIEWVAYTLEELPFFRTLQMGSPPVRRPGLPVRRQCQGRAELPVPDQPARHVGAGVGSARV